MSSNGTLVKSLLGCSHDGAPHTARRNEVGVLVRRWPSATKGGQQVAEESASCIPVNLHAFILVCMS